MHHSIIDCFSMMMHCIIRKHPFELNTFCVITTAEPRSVKYIRPPGGLGCFYDCGSVINHLTEEERARAQGGGGMCPLDP